MSDALTQVRTVLCFGDSNTWGLVPASDGERFPWDTRWPGVLQALLGSDWHVIEEGLRGRTTVLENPLVPQRNGREQLLPCLESHMPLDLVVIFLGTNDLQDRYAMPSLDVARAAAALARLACQSETGPRGGSPHVLLLGLPRLGHALPETMNTAAAKASELPRCYRIAAAEVGVPVLDLVEHVTYSDQDGIHLDAAGHRATAEAVAQAIASLFAASTPRR
jgi:lysophospholipase L1-like esterase